ncbi:17134_t:CDS:2 [Dentiscutata erythropus]|uniref:17134_t:CDS:1 n=1 Tax=Dentiscutata erythropus TaxID=1348616 RepID=A0A9N9EVR7_9GLOM|nr:17134_t:CDS:2 [Dentiscutata erythropus]
MTTSKKSWDDIVSQENPWLNSNMFLQKMELGNKAMHMSEKVPESSALSSHVETLSKSSKPPKELTITETQKKLPKENIPVSNLEENSKENAENSANLDIIMIYTEKVTKKNDENDDKLESLYIQEEVENQLSLNKTPRDELTMKDLARIFALQKSDTNRTAFFENWIPSFDEDKINIIAEDFNTNIDPTINRINQANVQITLQHYNLKDY